MPITQLTQTSTRKEPDMTTLRITVPDNEDPAATADYLHFVAEQIETGYTSGHVDAQRHWTATPFSYEKCNYCGRESLACSTNPCAGVLEDRGECTGRGQ